MNRLSTIQLADALARGIELAGIAVMILGAVGAIALFVVRLGRRAPARTGFESSYHELRANLGRAILLGLEFLVAADIIGTVAIEPTFRSLGVLALIVAIRTFLSFSLELEISGRWPWQRAKGDARTQPPTASAPAGGTGTA